MTPQACLTEHGKMIRKRSQISLGRSKAVSEHRVFWVLCLGYITFFTDTWLSRKLPNLGKKGAAKKSAQCSNWNHQMRWRNQLDFLSSRGEFLLFRSQASKRACKRANERTSEWPCKRVKKIVCIYRYESELWGQTGWYPPFSHSRIRES